MGNSVSLKRNQTGVINFSNLVPRHVVGSADEPSGNKGNGVEIIFSQNLESIVVKIDVAVVES